MLALKQSKTNYDMLNHFDNLDFWCFFPPLIWKFSEWLKFWGYIIGVPFSFIYDNEYIDSSIRVSIYMFNNPTLLLLSCICFIKNMIYFCVVIHTTLHAQTLWVGGVWSKECGNHFRRQIEHVMLVLMGYKIGQIFWLPQIHEPGIYWTPTVWQAPH